MFHTAFYRISIIPLLWAFKGLIYNFQKAQISPFPYNNWSSSSCSVAAIMLTHETREKNIASRVFPASARMGHWTLYCFIQSLDWVSTINNGRRNQCVEQYKEKANNWAKIIKIGKWWRGVYRSTNRWALLFRFCFNFAI